MLAAEAAGAKAPGAAWGAWLGIAMKALISLRSGYWPVSSFLMLTRIATGMLCSWDVS